MRRFFFTADDRRKDRISLCQKESHHICTVLRMHPGDKIELFDGSDTLYHAEIVALGPRVETRIVSAVTMDFQEGKSLWLGQGVIQTKKMEMLLQKCTELGVQCFTPMESSRCQGNLVRQCQQKQERWCRIIDEACKQCCRPSAMELEEVLSFEEIITTQGDNAKVEKMLLWEKERKNSLAHFSDDLKSCNSVQLLIGPEGGFTDKEVAKARAAGWRTVGLGNQTLRAETASLAAVTIVQHLLGNM